MQSITHKKNLKPYSKRLPTLRMRFFYCLKFNKMEHHFNVNIANVFGVEEAVLLHNIYFWIEKNRANKKHFYDGKYWTYNSIDAFTELFPYWSRRVVERIINNLIKKGALIKGNYNTSSYDRTSWYAITESVKSIYVNGEMDDTKQLNGITGTVTTIPYTNTISKTDVLPTNPKESFKLKLYTKWTEEEFKASIQDARETRAADPKRKSFSKEMLNEFFMYWKAPTPKIGVRKFQAEKSWDTMQRLNTWQKRS